MSNYSVKESESNFELISEIGGDNPRVIDDIEVKIKPKSFESDKEKNASVNYVHKILDKLIADLNDTFVPKLNNELKDRQDEVDLLYKDLDRLEMIAIEAEKDYKILEGNLNNLKEEVEKLKTGTIGGDNMMNGKHQLTLIYCSS
ncbi:MULTISPECIES: hypothetical protein [unclassified Wolbachia]|uniref:hypothetical protein n=1 Tax=unclassified Wolbachia TaxID=2640676 RepID=UPI001AE8156F|nr:MULTISPECIES: hypothetical protein [unclassified Wolbachia]MDX5518893.1 hypothetical protein [Wolbachia endosymbiont of Andrena agilissima]QTP62009.1 hypothetical protein HUB92_03760 [Wolbachia endosymbiont of Wiebesia pumilae]